MHDLTAPSFDDAYSDFIFYSAHFKIVAQRSLSEVVCGWIYDESQGWPEDGIAAGTEWEDIPDDWTCPDCGVSKADFEMIEV